MSSSTLPSVISKRASGQVRKAPSANLVNVNSVRQSLEGDCKSRSSVTQYTDDFSSHPYENSNVVGDGGKSVAESESILDGYGSISDPHTSRESVDKNDNNRNNNSNSGGDDNDNSSSNAINTVTTISCSSSETDDVKPLLADVKRKGRLARTRTPSSGAITTATQAVTSTTTTTAATSKATTTTFTAATVKKEGSNSSTSVTAAAAASSPAPRPILKKEPKNSSPPIDALAAANLYGIGGSSPPPFKAELTSLKRSMSQTTPTKSLVPTLSKSPGTTNDNTPIRVRAGKVRSVSMSQTTPSRFETTKSANSTPGSNRKQMGKIHVDLSRTSPLPLPKTRINNSNGGVTNGGILHSKSLNVTPRIERSGGSSRSRSNSAGILTPKPFPVPRHTTNTEGDTEVIISPSYEREKERGSILEELTNKKVEISPEKKPADRKIMGSSSSSSSSLSSSSLSSAPSSSGQTNNSNHNVTNESTNSSERPQNAATKSRKETQFVEASRNGNLSPKSLKAQDDRDKSGKGVITQQSNLPNISGNNRIIIQNEDLAKKNDAILQTKLQEAKAMNRKDTPGAAMFKFGLWNNVNKLKPSSLSSMVGTAAVTIGGGGGGNNQFKTRQGQDADEALSQPKTPTIITDSNVTSIGDSLPTTDSGPTMSISVTPILQTRVVSEGSRFVNKFNQDMSMYAIPSPDGSQGSCSSSTCSLAAASITPQLHVNVSGQPTRFRNLVDNAKHLGSVDTVSSLDTIDRADGYIGEVGTQFSFDEDDDYTADFSGPNTKNTENDDMLSIFSGESIEGDTSLVVLGQKIEGNENINPYARRALPADGNGGSVSAQPSVSTSSNEVEEEEEVKQHFKLQQLHASSSQSSLSSEAGAASPAASPLVQTQHDFCDEVQRLSSNNANTSSNGSENWKSSTDITTVAPAAVTRDPSYGSTASTKNIHGPVKFSWKKGPAIGEGSFGRVYRGINDSTGELIAIKQFCLLDGSEDEIEGFRREIETMESLEHRNIVRYFGTDRTDRNLFILMEFVPGGSIEHMLSQFGGFSGDLLRKFTHHILYGVNYLHEKGIIHRDIKGANVLVSSNGTAKLADFGCSKNLKGMFTASLEESLRAMKGSVQWMAPEVIKQVGCGPSSDIWSIGATIIEMATGSAPYSEFSNNLATLFHVATSNEPPKAPDSMVDDEEGSNLLKRCLVIDASQRASATELLQSPWFDGIDENLKPLLLPVTPRSS